ncbi:MAG: hypothetical protein KAI24_14585 [Planctomycetes bacterium]|nr:hypothetical protein [Planctomycetota bacterium]
MSSMPRWFWILPALAAAIWWPIGAWFASDDFLAVAYASELGNVARDFAGPQYGATDLWLFYRPLITLSFWFDQLVAGPWPPFGHVSNVLAHATSALLVASIWRRFLPDGQAFGAGLLWAMMPSHVGSIAWVVGRVDSHTTVWCLLAILLCLRGQERGGGRAAVALATVAALLSKELALVVPALCAWAAFARSGGGFGARVAAAWRHSWPCWLVLALYLPLRVLLLGRFGGYSGSRYELDLIALGAGSHLLDLLVPLRWIGHPDDDRLPPALFALAAATPVAIALLVAVVRRPRLVLGALVAWLVASAPISSFLDNCSNPQILRYHYLPSVALAGVLAAGHRWLVAAVALAWLWPTIAARAAQHDAHRECEQMHRAMLREAEALPPGPMFVAGLPHAHETGIAVQLHFGVDRMLRPPFCERDVPLFAWRPLMVGADVVRLRDPEGLPFALPEGSVWWFPDATALGRAPAPPPLPDLRLVGDDDGVIDCSTERLEPYRASYQAMIAAREPSFGVTMPDVRAMGLRVTIFTANGYLSCWCPNHALPGDPGSRLDIVRLLAGDPHDALWPRPGLVVQRFDPNGPFVGDQLSVPTTLDLDPTFPVLIEAGRFTQAPAAFTPTHRARRLLRLRFDRGYPAWVRRAQGQ